MNTRPCLNLDFQLVKIQGVLESTVTGYKLQNSYWYHGERKGKTIHIHNIDIFRAVESKTLLLKSLFLEIHHACHSAEGLTLLKAFPSRNLSNQNL